LVSQRVSRFFIREYASKEAEDTEEEEEEEEV